MSFYTGINSRIYVNICHCLSLRTQKERFSLSFLTHEPSRDLILNPPTKNFNEFSFEHKQTLPKEDIFTQDKKIVFGEFTMLLFLEQTSSLKHKNISQSTTVKLSERKKNLFRERG